MQAQASSSEAPSPSLLWMGATGHPAMAGYASQSLVKSPLTLGLLFLLISYNVYFSGRVLWKSRHLRPQDIESSMPR